MSNPTKIKKLNDYKLSIEQSYYKNLFSFLNGFSINKSLKVFIVTKFYK